MARSTDGEMFVHVQLSLSVSEASDYWYDPRVSKNVNFDIPVDMFSADALAKKTDKIMKELKEAYPKAKEEYEAKQAAEEAERVAKEAAKVSV